MEEMEIYLDLDYAGWKKLSDEWKDHNVFFESVYFLYGFDMSSNIYLIKGKDGLTLIDAGNDYTAFLQLSDIAFSHMDIRRIVLTHGHREHVMGVIELLRYPPHIRNSNFEVYMHESAPQELKDILKEAGINTKFIYHGDKLTFFEGFELEVIHTPGHTFDSLCFFERSTRTLFTGDTVLPFAYASSDDVAGGREDYHLLSLRMLSELSPENLLPGHGPVIYRKAQDVIRANRLAGIRKMFGELPWSEIAVNLAKKGWLDEALLACETALKDDENNPSLLQFKASLLNDMGRFDEALRIFDDLLGSSPKNPFLLLGKAVSLMGLGNIGESKRILEELRKNYPSVRDIDVYYGIALVLEGKPEEAMKIEGFKMEFAKAFERVVKGRGEDKGKA